MSKKNWYKGYDKDDLRVRIGQWIKIVSENGTDDYFTQIIEVYSGGFSFKEQDGYVASYSITGGCFRFIPERWITKNNLKDIRWE